MKVRRVAIVTNHHLPEASRLGEKIAGFLEERGIGVDDAAPDLVISLGGDGTMLRAAQLAHMADAPLFGVNLGTVGYLPEVGVGEESGALEQILAGDFRIEERMMLSCRVGDAEETAGLNEVLIERTTRHGLVRLAVRIEGESLAEFSADGVIVATPTGSTAYALSAGGPIVSPRAECLIVVPVNPHMIVSRPFVLAAGETVEVVARSSDPAAALIIDGRAAVDMPEDVPATMRRHPRALRLVRLAGPAFLERLRIKLGLPG